MKKLLLALMSVVMLSACSDDPIAPSQVMKEKFPNSTIYQIPGNREDKFIIEQDGVFKYALVTNEQTVIIQDTLQPVQIMGVASVIDTPEEWSQVSRDSLHPDTMVTWQDTSKHHIQFTGKHR